MGRISGLSWSQLLDYIAPPYQFLDLTPGAGNLLGQFEWEMRSALHGGCWLRNSGASPRDAIESFLSQILQAHPPKKYYLTTAACLGILRRAVVIDIGEGVIEMINPEIVWKSGELVDDAEGCLSSPGEYGMVKRPQKVKAVYCDRSGVRRELEGEGLLARAICHELDHLDGVLFKDLASEMLDPEELG